MYLQHKKDLKKRFIEQSGKKRESGNRNNKVSGHNLAVFTTHDSQSWTTEMMVLSGGTGVGKRVPVDYLYSKDINRV